MAVIESMSYLEAYWRELVEQAETVCSLPDGERLARFAEGWTLLWTPHAQVRFDQSLPWDGALLMCAQLRADGAIRWTHRYLGQSLAWTLPPENPALWRSWLNTIRQGESAVRQWLLAQAPECLGTDRAGWHDGLPSRKAAGRYYTPQALAGYLAEISLETLWQERITPVEAALAAEQWPLAVKAFQQLLPIRVCDPTVGGGAFLVAAFEVMRRWQPRLVGWARRLAAHQSLNNWLEQYPFLLAVSENEQVRWERYLLSHCLYGVDLEPRALMLTRQALSRVSGVGEALLGVNLAQGNALISPVRWTERARWQAANADLLAQQTASRNQQQRLAWQEQLPSLGEVPLPEACLPEDWSFLGATAEILQPLCWEWTFSEVFTPASDRSPGFDLILGNPPWDKIKANQRERQQIGAEPVDAEAREALRRFVRYSGHFPAQGAGQSRGSDDNLYRLILERAIQLAAQPGGQVCLIVKNGLRGDWGTTLLRRYLLETCPLQTLWGFTNRLADGERVFPDVDPNERFLAIQLTHAPDSNEASITTVHVPSLTSLFCHQSSAVTHWPQASISQLFPHSMEIPILANPEYAQLMNQMASFPRLREAPWRCQWRRDLDMTLDRHQMLTSDQVLAQSNPSDYLPVWEGSHVHPLAMAETPRYWALPQAGATGTAQVRLVIRTILPNSVRKLNATLIPGAARLGNSLMVLASVGFEWSDHDALIYLAVCLNSLSVEFWLRQTVTGMTLNAYKLDAVPVPVYDPTDPICVEIVEQARCLLGECVRRNMENHPASLVRFQPVVNRSERSNRWVLLERLVARRYGWTASQWDTLLTAFSKPIACQHMGLTGEGQIRDDKD